jgi:hypothetical protein
MLSLFHPEALGNNFEPKSCLLLFVTVCISNMCLILEGKGQISIDFFW